VQFIYKNYYFFRVEIKIFIFEIEKKSLEKRRRKKIRKNAIKLWMNKNEIVQLFSLQHQISLSNEGIDCVLWM